MILTWKIKIFIKSLIYIIIFGCLCRFVAESKHWQATLEFEWALTDIKKGMNIFYINNIKTN